VLENKNMGHLKSESLVHFPNTNSLMKISLGLILFTILSTALVYGETKSVDESNLTVHIVENAFLHNNSHYFDNTMISTNPGVSIIIINDDTVSHSFVSGSSNSNNEGKINYNDFLICELGEKIPPTGSGYVDDNTCNFNKDNRIITDKLSPGESISISIDEIGTFRIIDPDYPWMEIAIYSFPESSIESNNNESKVISASPVTKSVENISVYVNDVPFNVQYTTTGMSITGNESDTESMSLILFVDVTDSTGKLNVEFDRTFFDSVYDGVDDPFFILADGDETNFQEIQTNSLIRVLSINVPSGTEELEIIGSVFDSSKIIEIPVIEIPVIEIPVIEIPVIEIPVIEIPVIEIPVEDMSTNQCGPGTVLDGDVCVLDQRCGPGTVLDGDVCVLDSVSTTSPSKSSGISKELIISFTVALVIAGIIGIILAIIAKAHKSKN
jgi:hypothetical protein